MQFATGLKNGWCRVSRPKLSRLASSVLKSSHSSVVYDHLAVEAKWQKYWEDEGLFVSKLRPGSKKKYILDMFPYPSGAGLHVGHPEGYTATDILSRYYRMNGYDVLHPMGWDAFGLPAEQHAINTGTHPEITTKNNINTFKRQLKSLGFSYDWTREISTTDEDYYKWTQWIFLKLFKAGLAYQSEVNVNWCPALGTVLANEEVINGLSERGNHPVVRQPLRQWVLRITSYADRLESDLNEINWPEGTLSAQKQWIGRSEGVEIKFSVENQSSVIDVFTTRPDTIMGVTYLVLAPEHPLVSSLTTKPQEALVQEYIKTVSSKSDLERTSTGNDKAKTGVFLGSYVSHPLTHDKIPVWIADYVLPNYGTGAVMAVPAHDERDFEFAGKYSLPIIEVVKGVETSSKLPYFGDGKIINSGNFLNGLDSVAARERIASYLESNSIGKKKISYKLRDWIFSRQRYWGEPIPIYFPVDMDDPYGNPINGSKHKIRYDLPIPVEEEDLPLKLPDMVDFHPGNDPQGCLARAKDWRYFQKDGKWFARETNTMPQWAGSCWYYMRFADPRNSKQLIGEEESSWLPVDIYVGGQEHAVLHLLYARFWHKVLFDIGVVNHKEPFMKLIHQGMILGSDGEKMSKSRGNVINPDDVVREYGADALRLYEMFMGPLEAVKPWQTEQLMGVVRFRDKVFSLARKDITETFLDSRLEKEMHKTIKKVTSDIEKLSFNTAISSLMIFTNSLLSITNKSGGVPKVALQNLLLLLSPFAPHVAEECWNLMGHHNSISLMNWPRYDEKFCMDEKFTVVIQVNGKVRGKIEVQKDLEEKEVLNIALEQSNVQKFLKDQHKIDKVVYVPGKILNIVVCK